jgi:multiple antibiotic resistance protein
MLDYTEYTKFLVSLIAIVNPLGIIPIYISLTADYSSVERAKIARTVIIAATTILLVTAFLGQWILEFFGISINSFRVGGGIMLLLMGIGMLHNTSKGLKQNHELAQQSGESIAVVPLAMPLLAGPGAISTVIINAYKGHGVAHYSIIALDIILLGLLLWILLLLVPWIARRMSTNGINIATRIMGLILAAIAVEFIANGLKGLFPALAG